MELLKKALNKVLRELMEKEHTLEKEILLEDSGLNVNQDVNRASFEDKKIQEIYDKVLRKLHDEEGVLKEEIRHLKKYHEMQDHRSVHDLVKQCLMPYDNRKIKIKEGKIHYEKISEVMHDYKIKDGVAGYGRSLFEPLDKKLWERRPFKDDKGIKFGPPREGDRMAFYVFGGQTEKALSSIVPIIGEAVADKRKKYTKYDSRDYKINEELGLHMRPIAELAKIMKEYPKADAWIRTDSVEKDVRGGIFDLMTMIPVTRHEPKITILFKPKEQAGEFYRKLETLVSSNYKDKRMFEQIPSRK